MPWPPLFRDWNRGWRLIRVLGVVGVAFSYVMQTSI